ncbi:PIG-L family deacetylase [Thermocladium modestius]|uniref:PIG-L family deacetylase n=1 Tax=Thermocladium modestius TaxID=62609 RepID=A0A830GWC3_9CREN|nr:PIG-L family deacetylase [Thermocladium modestius]GGP19599.1 PIG-L family deacetylase [Thermocladium modestius]
MKILYVSPHPDDECDNAGGTLTMLSRHNDIYVFYLTDGRLGSPNPAERGDELARIRKDEALKGLTVLGIDQSNAYFFNYPDGALSKFIYDGVKTIMPVLKRISPDIVFYPSTLDIHPDHWAAGKIIVAAIGKSRLNPGQLSYLNWEPRPSIDVGIMLKYIKWKTLRKKAIYVRVTDFKDIKFKCMEKHESQLRYLNESYIDRFFNADYERFYIERKTPNMDLLASLLHA